MKNFKFISELLTALNILFILCFTLGTLKIIALFTATITASTLPAPFLVQLVFGSPHYLIVVMGILLMTATLLKENISSKIITIVINIILLLGLIVYGISLYVNINTH